MGIIRTSLVIVKQIFSATQKMTTQRNKQLTQLSPYNHELTVELADSCFAGDCPHFGSAAFWRENMEHLVEADRGWRYMMGEQVPESFIMSQLLGLLLPSAKTSLAG